jgi:hypothetical protein
MGRGVDPTTRRGRATGDHGLSTVVTAVSLLISALLILLVLKATVGSGSGSTSPPPRPVSAADTGLAQQNLAGALATLQQVDAGGQGSVDAATLQAADPALSFPAGPSAAPSTVSVTPGTDGTSVTLAVRATDSTCWLVWWSSATGTWYGAQTSQPSCTAPSESAVPAPGPVSSSSIGWQQGSFPTA